SLHGLIGPIVFEYNKRADIFHILLKPENEEATIWPAAISKITKAYKSIYPDNDFTYSFFDDTIAKFYTSEQQTSGLLKWATGLAILISCLGLFGLVIYTTNVRTKEIGIRKIFGASVTNIVTILSKDFIRLVIIAFLIATPVAWWAANKWMENFAYRTSMSWWVFAISGALMILISLVTLSMQIIKAATANPVKSLRTE
ncbi:MAG TPA: FtsX-like permease family protein, partial [Puia sp.]